MPDNLQGSIATCNRDIHVGGDLAMMARFPLLLLDQWEKLDFALSGLAAQTVKTTTP
jgi:hypothetical protein